MLDFSLGDSTFSLPCPTSQLVLTSIGVLSPLRSDIEDVSTPVVDPQDECDCTTDGADGFDDLTLNLIPKRL